MLKARMKQRERAPLTFGKQQDADALYRWLEAVERARREGREPPGRPEGVSKRDGDRERKRRERARAKRERMEKARAERAEKREQAAKRRGEQRESVARQEKKEKKEEERPPEAQHRVGRRSRTAKVPKDDVYEDVLGDTGITTGKGGKGGKGKDKGKGGKSIELRAEFGGAGTPESPWAGGGTGGVNYEGTQPIGGVESGQGPFAYFNAPGDVEQAANTGFGPITLEGINAVRASRELRPSNTFEWAPPEAVPSRYLQDDDDRFLNQIYGTDLLPVVQEALKARHPGKSKWTPGVLDDNTREWTKQAMGDANAAGISLMDLLFGEGIAVPAEDTSGSSSGGYGGGGGGGGGGGMAGPVTDPEAIRQAADDIAQDMIGRRVNDPAIMEQIIAEIHQMELAEEMTGVTTDIDAEIRRKLRERVQGEAGAYDYVGAANVVAQMFSAGPGGVTPQTQQVQPVGGGPA